MFGRFKVQTTLPEKMTPFLSGEILHGKDFSYEKRHHFEIYFKGEIYNRRNLELENLSDIDVIASLYILHKEKCFAQIDGSFIAVIKEDKKVVIARDHHATGGQIYYTSSFFSTSLIELKEIETQKLTPNYQSLTTFLMTGVIQAPNTAFLEVKKLQPGNVLVWENNSIITFPLYDTTPKTIQEERSLDDYAKEYATLHQKAIARRIGNSQNIGILLSGGYDSGCNLAGLRKVYSGKVYSYSIGFKNDQWSELPLAKVMSETFNTSHHTYEIDGSEILNLPEIVRFLGDPFVEGGVLVNYSVMKLIGEQSLDVILGGDGSDQYFGTSGRELALYFLLAKKRLLPFVKLGHSFLKNQAVKEGKAYKLRFHLDKILNPLMGDCFGFSEKKIKQLIQKSDYYTPFTKDKIILDSFEKLYEQHRYNVDINNIIDQIILFKASNMASLFNQKLTFPYMDLSLYKFIQNLPLQNKCAFKDLNDLAAGHGTSKYLLKYAYHNLLPEVITNKKKQGGFAPMPIFFKDQKRQKLLTDFILQSSIFENFLSRKAVEDFLIRYAKESKEQKGWFWYHQSQALCYNSLLSLTVWWEEFIEGHKVIF